MTTHQRSRPSAGLTRRGWTVVGGSLGLLVGGRILGADELSVLGVAGLALLVGALVWVVVPRAQPTVTRRVDPARLHVGDSARVDLVVEPSGTRATPLLELTEPIDGGALRARFLVAPIARGASVAPAYRLPTERRGELAVGPTRVLTSDPLGLAQCVRAIAPIELVLIRPRVHPISPPNLGAGRRVGDESPSLRANAPDAAGEFLAVRPYEMGDDPRRVHWRSTARTGDLMVRQFEQPRRGATLVILHTRATHPDVTHFDATHSDDGDQGVAFEHAVEAVASITTCLQRMRRPVECATSNGVMLTRTSTDIGPGLLDRLATVTEGPDAEDQDGVLIAMAQERRRQPLELVILVTARFDAVTQAALDGWSRRAATLVVVTGGMTPRTTGGTRVVDARTAAFPDAWQRGAHARRRAPSQSSGTWNYAETSSSPPSRLPR